MYLFVCVYWGGGGKGKTFYNVKQLEMQNIRPFKALENTSLCFRDKDSVHIFQCQVRRRTMCRYSSNHHDWSLDINMKIFSRALNIASKLVIRAQDVGKTRLEEDFGGFYSKL